MSAARVSLTVLAVRLASALERHRARAANACFWDQRWPTGAIPEKRSSQETA